MLSNKFSYLLLTIAPIAYMVLPALCWFILGVVLAFQIRPRSFTPTPELEKILQSSISKVAFHEESKKCIEDHRRQTVTKPTMEEILQVWNLLKGIDEEQFREQIHQRRAYLTDMINLLARYPSLFITNNLGQILQEIQKDRTSPEHLERIIVQVNSLMANDGKVRAIYFEMITMGDEVQKQTEVFKRTVLNDLASKDKEVKRIKAMSKALITQYPNLGAEETRNALDNLTLITRTFNKNLTEFLNETATKIDKKFIEIFAMIREKLQTVCRDSSQDQTTKEKASRKNSELKIQAEQYYNSLKQRWDTMFDINSSEVGYLKRVKQLTRIFLVLIDTNYNIQEGIAKLNEKSADLLEDELYFDQVKGSISFICQRISAFKNQPAFFSEIEISMQEYEAFLISLNEIMTDFVKVFEIPLEYFIQPCVGAPITRKPTGETTRNGLRGSFQNLNLEDNEIQSFGRLSRELNFEPLFTTSKKSEFDLLHFLNKYLSICFKEWSVNKHYQVDSLGKDETALD
jgi:hypothetical protein